MKNMKFIKFVDFMDFADFADFAGVKKIVLAFMMMVMLACGGGVLMLSESVMAQGYNEVCADGSIPEDLKKESGCYQTKTVYSPVVKMLNMGMGLVALVGVITVIVSGQRMISADGDVGKIRSARVMLIYGVVGIVVSLLAFSIVNFVMTKI